MVIPPDPDPPSILSHTSTGISMDTKVNLIIGILTIIIGALSMLLAWSTWRLTHDRRRRKIQCDSPPTESTPLKDLLPPGPRLGYELAVMIGRSHETP